MQFDCLSDIHLESFLKVGTQKLLRDRLVSRRNDKKVPAPSEKGKVDEK